MNAAPALKEGNVTQIPEIEFAQIEPTTRCNCTCGFCCGRSMEQRDITLETFAKTLDAFPNLKHVELQGEGEPLLHHDVFEMARMLRSRDVSVSIITNGSQLLKRNAIPQILDLGLEKVSVSIESADAETFKKIRGGKLETVVAGIRELIQERNRRGLARPLIDFAVTVLESHHLVQYTSKTNSFKQASEVAATSRASYRTVSHAESEKGVQKQCCVRGGIACARGSAVAANGDD